MAVSFATLKPRSVSAQLKVIVFKILLVLAGPGGTEICSSIPDLCVQNL
jgi:hypothetical protein